MTSTMLALLTLQILLGALDNILHHEITERLPSRPSARRELALHSAREGIYGCLFLVFAWIDPRGVFATCVLLLLAAEIVITIADFLEEDHTRNLPRLERVLHTLLAIFYGGFLASTIPWLSLHALDTSGVTYVSHGVYSWFFSISSVGVFAFSIRNFLAVRRLGRHQPIPSTDHQSGRTILVTGGTGFVGAALVAKLHARGDRVFVHSRDPRQARALLGEDVHHISSLEVLPPETKLDAIVNLAGAPIIGLPWTANRRKTIWESRINGTSDLVAWMRKLDHQPHVLVSGSAIGYYGNRGDELLLETAENGKGFAAELCAAWEAAAMSSRESGTRVVCLRIGLVLHSTGGALPMMAFPAHFALGAIFGGGQQWMSWITRADLLRMIISAIDQPTWSGPINAVAPEPSRHADFQKSMARTLRRPLYLNVPAWLIGVGMGEMSSIFLYSQRVVPAKAQGLGFTFDVHWASDALELLIGPKAVEYRQHKRPLQSAVVMDDNAGEQHPSPGVEHDADCPRLAPFPLRPQGPRGARGEAA